MAGSTARLTPRLTA
jgi:hypothetical protein